MNQLCYCLLWEPILNSQVFILSSQCLENTVFFLGKTNGKNIQQLRWLVTLFL